MPGTVLGAVNSLSPQEACKRGTVIIFILQLLKMRSTEEVSNLPWVITVILIP